MGKKSDDNSKNKNHLLKIIFVKLRSTHAIQKKEKIDWHNKILKFIYLLIQIYMINNTLYKDA